MSIKKDTFHFKKWLSCQPHFFTVDFTMKQRFSFSIVLSATLKKKPWQTSSKYFFKLLHKISKRTTPEMWSNYSAACGMYNVVTTRVPEDTFVNLTENFLNSERNQGLQFTRSNRLRLASIACQIISRRYFFV